MAQTVTNGMATTPFPLPPGLGPANGTGAAVTAAATVAPSSSDAGTFSATQEADTPEQQGIIHEVRRTVLEEVDAKVAEKMKDLWAKGNRMIKKAEDDSQQKNATILAELQHCLQKQESLRTENEHLKTLITSMAQQLNMLGGYFGSLAGPKISTPTPCSLAALSGSPVTNGTIIFTGGDSSSASASSTIQDSPQTDYSATMSAGSFPPLPSVPDFPFPQTPPAPTPTSSAATPLSLAEALSSETPSSSVPVSLMGSLPPPCQGQRIFSFTLRKADGSDLGLNVSHHEEDKALRVEGVRPEGAVEAWNRQCVGSTASEKAVLAGDRIVSVNGFSNDPAKMLEECRDKQLLKLTVIRGEAVPAPKTPVLRADAPEFVPPGGSASAGLHAISEQPEPEQPAQEETARRVWKDDEDKVENPPEI